MSTSKNDLIDTWANWAKYRPQYPPYFLTDDENFLPKKLRCNDHWDKQKKKLEYLEPKNRNFHLGLLPAPYCGNLENASIFILMLNPGLGPGDYYAEYEVPAFKKTLINNLKQNEGTDFFPLNPKFSWSGAFMYWHKKLGGLIQEIQRRNDCSFSNARQILRERLASIEIFPYHSQSFNSFSLLEKLPSSILARSFVQSDLFEKVGKKKAVVIFARSFKVWDPTQKFKESEYVKKYKGAEAQGAHFGPETRGGEAILDFLKAKHVIK